MGLLEKVFGGGGKIDTSTSGGFRPEIESGLLDLASALASASPAGVETLRSTAAGEQLGGGPALEALKERLGLGIQQNFTESIIPSLLANAQRQGAFVSSGTDRQFGDAQEQLSSTLADAFAQIDFQTFQQERQNQIAAANQLLGQTQAASAPFATSTGSKQITQTPSLFSGLSQLGSAAGDLAGGVSDVTAAFKDPVAFSAQRAKQAQFDDFLKAFQGGSN